MRGQETNRLEVAQPFIKPCIEDMCEIFGKKIAEVKQKIRDHIDQHPDLHNQKELVTAYPLNQIYQSVPSELQSMDCIPWLPLFGGSLKFDNTLGHKLLF
jgi:hypothetical protein